MVSLAVIVMAAGKGTRMKNPDVAKVMYPVGDMPMIEHVVRLALHLRAVKTLVIVGWQKDSVIDHLARTVPEAVCIEQNPQLGTGHAVMQAEPLLVSFEGDVLVLSGDVPLLRPETVQALIDAHGSSGAAATVLTTILDDPSGYGRIVRDAGGSVTGIVEQRDASDEQRKICEINSGIYVFKSKHLVDGLAHITPDNAQKEYYLTDVFGYYWKHKLPVSAVVCHDPLEVRGINTAVQLEEARQALAARGS
ncbi:MAG: sugar phosphate nucleotidyltransferase [Bacteroidota bacterium]